MDIVPSHPDVIMHDDDDDDDRSVGVVIIKKSEPEPMNNERLRTIIDAPIEPPRTPFYYIHVPYQLAVWGDMSKLGYMKKFYDRYPKNEIDQAQLPHIQSMEERITLGNWMHHVCMFYALNNLLRYDKSNASLHAIMQYRLNDFASITNFYSSGEAIRDTQNALIRNFHASFKQIGRPLPRYDSWTLFTGEGLYGTSLLERCLSAKNSPDGIVKVPMQISATWNFNSALNFLDSGRVEWDYDARDHKGGIIALHWYPRKLGNTSSPPFVMAHLLQDVCSYYGMEDPVAQSYECEILLQPGITLRYMELETVPGNMPVYHMKDDIGSIYQHIPNLKILHMEVIDADDQ